MTPDRARELFCYDSASGTLTWRVDRGPARAGNVVGFWDAYGYRRVYTERRNQLIHRIVWLMMTGVEPPDEIDHVDGDRANNRWANLRQATRSQNNRNQKVRSDNKAGLKGASFNCGKWRSRIRVDGRTILIGRFPTAQAAHNAYLARAKEVFGDFARD